MQVADKRHFALQAPGESADQPKLLHNEQQGPLLLTAGKHSAGDLTGSTSISAALDSSQCQQWLCCWVALSYCAALC